MPWGYYHPCPCGHNLHWVGEDRYQCENRRCVFFKLPFEVSSDGEIGDPKDVLDAFKKRDPLMVHFLPVHWCYKEEGEMIATTDVP